jgi:hypothetical protein
MRGIVFLLVIGLLSLVVVGCSRKATPSVTTMADKKDSTHTEIKERLVPYPVPGEKVIVHDTIRCDEKTNKPMPAHIKAKSGKAFADVNIDKDGSITVSGGCDSLMAVLKARDSIIFQLKQENSNTNKESVETEFKTRSIDIFCRWFSGICLCVLLGLIMFYTIKTKGTFL